MAATEAVIKDVVTASLQLLRKNPDLAEQFLSEVPEHSKDSFNLDTFKLWIGSTVVEVKDGWPTQPPKSAALAIIPGEIEESTQFVGSELGDGVQYSPASGYETTIGTYFSATHHILIYTVNEAVCNYLGYAVMWGLLVGGRYLEANGIQQARIIRGPTQIATEFSPPTGGPDNVFRTEVHLVHHFLMSYTNVELAALVDQITINIQDGTSTITVDS